ncbi:MFS general substrate transporter [Xylaria bambusicola]|uniref:MFS general substrate transporter n=1 Tax=Xylaria bambusicola TaxID=326684 RepID=UPI0020082F8F|nr:MFS general substrate transporter [Xylaria bambusicola]KAI0514861.1 MFS general substrate transporter [Xylaria bambusicola]
MTSEAQPRAHGRAPIVMIDAEETRQDSLAETTALLDARSGQQVEDEARRQSWGADDDFHGLPWWKTPTVYWLIGPYFLYTLAFGGVIVPKIELIVTLVCRHYFAEQQVLDPDQTFLPVIIGGNNLQCNSAPVQKNVAAFTLVLSALAGGLSAFTAPKLGSLSDRFGRKRLLVIASFGGIVNETITILAAKYPDVIDYRFLILGSFFDGITGSFTAVSVLGSSYVSDCTPPSKRAVSLGYLQACLFGGLAIGPILAGKLTVLTHSVLSPFYVSLGCHLTLICFIWFVVPESLSKQRRIAAQEKYQAEQEALRVALSRSVESQSRLPAWIANDALRTWLLLLLNANPLAPLKMFVPSGRENQRLRRNLLLMGFIDTVLISATMGAGTVLILYAKFMFDWKTLESSRFVSIISFFRVIVLLVFFPIVNYIFRTRPLRHQQKLNGNIRAEESHSGADNLDIWLLRFALLFDTIGVLGYVFVRTEELFILSAICTSFGGLASATIQAMLTKQVPTEYVGSMLGAGGLLHAVSRVFAPVIFDGIYAGTIESFPQTFVVVLASLFGLSILASLFVRPYLVLSENGYAPVSEQDSRNQDSLTSIDATERSSETLPRV